MVKSLKTIQSLHKELLSLPDGRTPKEIREEWNKQREHAEHRRKLIKELVALQSNLIFRKTKRQREITKELAALGT